MGAALFPRRTAAMTVKITIRPNGPYLVEGECELYDPTGAQINTAGQARIALCRCGSPHTQTRVGGGPNKVGLSGPAGPQKKGGAPPRPRGFPPRPGAALLPAK